MQERALQVPRMNQELVAEGVEGRGLLESKAFPFLDLILEWKYTSKSKK